MRRILSALVISALLGPAAASAQFPGVQTPEQGQAAEVGRLLGNVRPNGGPQQPGNQAAIHAQQQQAERRIRQDQYDRQLSDRRLQQEQYDRRLSDRRFQQEQYDRRLSDRRFQQQQYDRRLNEDRGRW